MAEGCMFLPVACIDEHEQGPFWDFSRLFVFSLLISNLSSNKSLTNQLAWHSHIVQH